MLCALVCKDFSHGQPDVLHLSCVVEKLFTLGGKEERGKKGRMEGEGGKGEGGKEEQQGGGREGMRERGRKKGEMEKGG